MSNLTAPPNTIVAFEDGSPAYTDDLGVVRGRDGEPIEDGNIVWVKSRDAPDRDIVFQTSSDDTGMLVGMDDNLDDAWDSLHEVNEVWEDGETYSVTVCFEEQEPSLTKIDE